MTNTISIALASDQKYFPGLALTILTTLICVPPERRMAMRFYVLDGGIADSSWNLLTDKISLISSWTEIHRIPFAPPLPKEVRLLGNSLITYSRLYLSEVIPEKRVIYLDCDLLVLADISAIWGVAENSSFPIAAVIDQRIPFLQDELDRKLLEERGIKADLPYFNAGVFVANLEYWRQLDVSNKTIGLLLSQPPHFFNYWDQSLLNIVFAGQVQVLPGKWNILSQELPLLTFHNTDCIIHYASEIPIFRFKPYPTHYLYKRIFQCFNLDWDAYRSRDTRLTFLFLIRGIMPLIHFCRYFFSRDSKKQYKDRAVAWQKVNRELDIARKQRTSQKEVIDTIISSRQADLVKLR